VAAQFQDEDADATPEPGATHWADGFSASKDDDARHWADGDYDSEDDPSSYQVSQAKPANPSSSTGKSTGKPANGATDMGASSSRSAAARDYAASAASVKEPKLSEESAVKKTSWSSAIKGPKGAGDVAKKSADVKKPNGQASSLSLSSHPNWADEVEEDDPHALPVLRWASDETDLAGGPSGGSSLPPVPKWADEVEDEDPHALPVLRWPSDEQVTEAGSSASSTTAKNGAGAPRAPTKPQEVAIAKAPASSVPAPKPAASSQASAEKSVPAPSTMPVFAKAASSSDAAATSRAAKKSAPAAPSAASAPQGLSYASMLDPMLPVNTDPFFAKKPQVDFFWGAPEASSSSTQPRASSAASPSPAFETKSGVSVKKRQEKTIADSSSVSKDNRAGGDKSATVEGSPSIRAKRNSADEPAKATPPNGTSLRQPRTPASASNRLDSASGRSPALGPASAKNFTAGSRHSAPLPENNRDVDTRKYHINNIDVSATHVDISKVII
jgi:hypothetical protein